MVPEKEQATATVAVQGMDVTTRAPELGWAPATEKEEDKTMKDTVLNKHVILRCSSSGVHFGVLMDWDGQTTAMLKDSRRLWEWSTGGTGISLSEVAICGIDQAKSRITMPLPEHIVTDVIEIIPCHGMAIATISGAEVAKP